MPSIGPITGPPPWQPYDRVMLQEAALLGYWPGGESSGVVARDVKAGNNGVYTAGPTLGQTGLLYVDPSTAVKYAAASSQYVAIARGTFPQVAIGGGFTVSCWFSPTTLGIVQVIFCDDFSNGPCLYIDAANKVNYRFGGSGGGGMIGTTVLSAGIWNIVGVHDAGVLRVYLNNVVEPAPVIITGIGTQSAALSIGCRDSSDLFLNGTIAKVAAIGRAWAPADVAKYYLLGTT